jgi:2',3'-cyclic-nucleotide 2'-phosphodiesterase
MKLLYIGDIMAEMGMKAVESALPRLIAAYDVDFVVAQSENVSEGKGMTVADYERLRAAGVQAFTGGNHTPSKPELLPLLEDLGAPVVGPVNMTDYPTFIHKLVETAKGSVLVVSLLGSIVGKHSDLPTVNPLKKLDEILANVPRDSYVASVVNLHGDFSSEKIVLGHYFDGRVSLVVGDHWHVPTADAQVLPKGTAHITDVGMCGSLDSSLGVTFDSIIPRWRDGYQTRNELAITGRSQFCAVLADIDETTGSALGVEQIRQVW